MCSETIHFSMSSYLDGFNSSIEDEGKPREKTSSGNGGPMSRMGLAKGEGEIFEASKNQSLGSPPPSRPRPVEASPQAPSVEVEISMGTEVLVQPVSEPQAPWRKHTMTADRCGELVERDGLGTMVVRIAEFLVQVHEDQLGLAVAPVAPVAPVAAIPCAVDVDRVSNSGDPLSREDTVVPSILNSWVDFAEPPLSHAAVAAASESIPVPATNCGHPATWQDPSGVWRCHVCQPPPHPSMIREWAGDASLDPRKQSHSQGSPWGRGSGAWLVGSPDSLPWAYAGPSVPPCCARPGETLDEWWSRTRSADELIWDIKGGRCLWAEGETPNRARFQPPLGARVFALVRVGKEGNSRLQMKECQGGLLPENAVSATWVGSHTWQRVGR